MKIYTRTGDAGQTSLVGGKRVSKSSVRLESYGTVDELNSHLGLLAAYAGPIDPASATFVRAIQNKLFNLGAYLATDNTDISVAPSGIAQAEIQAMETEIDRLEESLPALTSFILPGGCQAACQANIARTVCRRAERRVIALSETAPVNPLAIGYLNRLSDYLFDLGRHLNHLSSTPEQSWQP
ncbi:MAG: cob(I)yrinic acid a,c-diamide adenosyltransferase [Muribaculaceae bacterium]|nr:cob(I)yrinic acid a,c-diamide adenosyltransferase [Muribaculaceae bacterium]